MTYHNTVSGIAMLGLSGGLGADLSNNNNIRIRFQPGRGVSTRNAPDILRMLKQRLDALRVLYNSLEVGYGLNNTFLVKGRALGPGMADRVDLRWLADKAIAIARDVSAASGYNVYLIGVKNDSKNEYIGGPPIPAQTAPSGQQMTSSTPPAAPPAASPDTQLSTPSQAPASATMTVKVLQQRLIASGARLRGGDDGRWGSGTKGALEAFASARGISLPTLGARSDYMQSGGNVTIPAALDAALPAPGRVAPSRRQPPRESREPADAAQPPVPADGQQDGSAPPPGDSAEPWWKSKNVQIGAVVTLVVLAVVAIGTKR